MELVVLASGLGKRLKKINKNRPKCLLKIKDDKTLIDYLSVNFSKFERIFIVGGYKYKMLKKYENKKVKVIYNKQFKKTNMVHSLFLASKYISQDVVVSYSDIIFDKKIMHKLIEKNGNVMPLKKNWLDIWKIRMNFKEIKLDSENVIFDKKKITKIGGSYSKYPKGQYMGIIKFTKKSLINILKYYKFQNNLKIDMTSFLNMCIQKKIIEMNYFLTNLFWYEIDNPKDFLKLKDVQLKF